MLKDEVADKNWNWVWDRVYYAFIEDTSRDGVIDDSWRSEEKDRVKIKEEESQGQTS